MKKRNTYLTILVFFIVFLGFWIPNKINEQNENKKVNEAKSFLDDLSQREYVPYESTNESLTKDNRISFKIPENWRVYNEEELKKELETLEKNTSIKGYFDYFLRLKSNETYPYMSIVLEQNEAYSSLSIDDFAEEMKLQFNIDFFKIVEETYKIPLDFKDAGNYIDKKSKILYLFIEATDPFAGKITNVYSFLLRNDYMVGVFFTAKQDKFQDNIDDFYYLIKSINVSGKK